jgi:8-oxo-dGTP diphosphatase
MRKVICAAIIKDKKILLVRKKETWIMPGGKPQENENDLVCLNREISEELPGLKILKTDFYKEISGKTPHVGDVINARVYLAEAEGEFLPSAEINDVSWFDRARVSSSVVSDLTQNILAELFEDRIF